MIEPPGRSTGSEHLMRTMADTSSHSREKRANTGDENARNEEEKARKVIKDEAKSASDNGERAIIFGLLDRLVCHVEHY